MWSLLRLGERKIAKMVAAHWPRWPPCPYIAKKFKNLLQNRGRLGAESLHKSSGTRGLPKLLEWWSYIDVWSFYGEGSLLSYVFVWAPYICVGKMLRKIAKMVAVYWPRWLPCLYMVNTFKNLFLQNQISPGALSLHKSSGTGDLPKLQKWWSYVDIDLFTARSTLLPMHLYAPYTFIWEKCWEFIFWTSPL